MSDGPEQWVQDPATPSAATADPQGAAWRQAFDAVSDPIFVHDAEFRIVRANRAYTEQAGLPYEQILGRRYWEVFPRRDGPTPGCRGGVEGVVDETVDRILVTAGGRLFRTRNFPVRDPSGHYLESLHLMEDVTEAQRVQDELRLLGSALEQVGDGVMILTPELTVRHANPALLELLGEPLDALQGAHFGTWCPHWTDLIRHGGAGDTRQTGETELMSGGGEALPVRYHLSAVRDPADALTGYVLTFTDLRGVRREYRQLERLARETEELATLKDFEQLGRRAVAAAAHLTGADGALVMLREGESMRYRWQTGLPAPIRERLLEQPIPLEDGVAGEVIRSGKPRLIRDHASDAAGPSPLAAQGIRSAVAVPLAGGAGALIAVSLSPERRFSAEHIGVLEALARPLATALEQARLLAALTASEARLRKLADAVPHVLYELSVPDFRLHFVSAGIDNLADLARHDPQRGHWRWLRHMHPDDRPRVEEEVRRALASADGYVVEYRQRPPGGDEWRWLEDRGQIERGPDGQAVSIFGAAHDVTARKQMETALRESEARFRFLFDTLNQGIVFFNGTGEIIAANTAAAVLLEHPAGTLVGRHFEEFTFVDEHGRPLPAGERPVARALAGGRPLRDVLIGFPLANDDTRWFRVDVFPRCSVAEKVDLVYASFTDVTEARRTEASLRETERRFRSLFERAPLPMLLIDDQGRYLDANGAAQAFLETSLDALRQRTVLDYTPPGPEGEAIMARHRQLWRSGGQAETAFRMNGRVKWLDLTIVPEVLEGRSVAYGIGRDITAWKLAEETVAGEAEERARLGQCAEALVRVREELDARARTEGASSASLSHLRTRLSTIIGFTDLLLKDPALDPRQRDYLRRVHEAGQGIGGLLDELGPRGAGGARWQRHPLRPVVEEAVAALQAMVGPVEVAIDVPPELTLESERRHLVHGLISLLANVAKARPGQPITVSSGVEDDRLVVGISGEGSGPVAQEVPGGLGEYDLAQKIVAGVLHGQLQWRVTPEGHGGYVLLLPYIPAE